MFNVTLINLAEDARTVAALAHFEQRDLGLETLRERLRNFSEIDPVENASADAEIRVKVGGQSFLIRTVQGKLVLYDMNRRDLPAQLLTVTEAMNELDGTASAARDQAVARATVAPWETTPMGPVMVPTAAPSKLRVIAMTITVVLLLGAILYLSAPFADSDVRTGFVPVKPAERNGLARSLTGVYLTGSEPGQHGIVLGGPGELKLFELAAIEAPRVVFATYELERVGPMLCLATDQPGGMIEVPGNDTLVYCGEIYQRIP